jgi:hypothetical protein
VFKVLVEQLAQLEQLVYRALPDLLVLLVQLDLPDHKVLLVQAQLVQLGYKELLDRSERPEPQGSEQLVQPEFRVLLDLLEQPEQLAQELLEPQVLVAQQVSRVILEQLVLLA